MTLNEAIDILQEHQHWRRGLDKNGKDVSDDYIPEPLPANYGHIVGMAIEIVLKAARQLNDAVVWDAKRISDTAWDELPILYALPKDSE